MTRLAAHRRSPAALAFFVLLGLVVTGLLYVALKPDDATATAGAGNAEDVAAGEELFLANCASCHGVNGQGNGTAGPPLAGVGALAVEFQVGTGRMPMTQPGVQAQAADQIAFSQQQIDQMAAFVASLGPGPGIPEDEWLDPAEGDVAAGGAIFRTNCAMCHNSSGAGGALTQGKDAPSLMQVDPLHIYAAMETGPQSMPVFNDTNLSPKDKQDVIAYLKYIETEASPGGHSLGNLGPVADGLFAWTIFIGILIGFAVWLGKKAA